MRRPWPAGQRPRSLSALPVRGDERDRPTGGFHQYGGATERRGSMGTKVEKRAVGKVDASWSGGATRKAPRTVGAERVVSQWAAARQPRLCA